MTNIEINTTENPQAPEPHETERRSKLSSFLGKAAMKAMEFGVVGTVMITAQEAAFRTVLPQGELSIPVLAGTAAAVVASHHYYNESRRKDVDVSLE